MLNIINKLPHLARPTLKKLIYKAFTARSYKEGMARAGTIIADYKESFPAAMKCLEQDLEESLTALKFPLVHRIRIRTTNLLERLFGEARRRTKIIPRFTSEASGLPFKSVLCLVLADIVLCGAIKKFYQELLFYVRWPLNLSNLTATIHLGPQEHRHQQKSPQVAVRAHPQKIVRPTTIRQCLRQVQCS